MRGGNAPGLHVRCALLERLFEIVRSLFERFQTDALEASREVLASLEAARLAADVDPEERSKVRAPMPRCGLPTTTSAPCLVEGTPARSAQPSPAPAAQLLADLEGDRQRREAAGGEDRKSEVPAEDDGEPAQRETDFTRAKRFRTILRRLHSPKMRNAINMLKERARYILLVCSVAYITAIITINVLIKTHSVNMGDVEARPLARTPESRATPGVGAPSRDPCMARQCLSP